MAKRTRRGSRAAETLDARMGNRQVVTASVTDAPTGGEGSPSPVVINVPVEALAAATYRGDQTHGTEKLAKFNANGEQTASMYRAGRDDKTQSVAEEDWYKNVALVLKNAQAFLGKNGSAAFIRNNGGVLEVGAADDALGSRSVNVGAKLIMESGGNVGAGIYPAAPLHVAGDGDQLLLEDMLGNVTRFRSDAFGLTITPEAGATALSGKLTMTDPDGTTLTIDKNGVLRESGLVSNYYQKRGMTFNGDTVTGQAHSIDGQSHFTLRALRGFLKEAEIADYSHIDIYSADQWFTTLGGIKLHAPLEINLDAPTVSGNPQFTGNISFADVVLPANTGMFTKVGHLKVLPSYGPPTALADGHLWGTATDGLHWYSGGTTWNMLSLLSESGGITTLNGGLNIAGTGRRITGNFHDATLSNRVNFQTNIANQPTGLAVIPNGAAEYSSLGAFARENPDNSEMILSMITYAAAILTTWKTGTSVSVPLQICQDLTPILTLTTGKELNLTPSTRVSVSGNVDATGVYKIGGTQVLGARKTGWGAATGTATRSTFATSTVTLSQLAERVKALIDDLVSHGVIGA